MSDTRPMNVTNPRNGNRYYLLTNGPQTIGVLEAPDDASAEDMIRLHLSEGQTYGALQARPAEPHEAIAWHLGCALWSAKHLETGAWNDLRAALQPFFDARPSCRPE